MFASDGSVFVSLTSGARPTAFFLPAVPALIHCWLYHINRRLADNVRGGVADQWLLSFFASQVYVACSVLSAYSI